jgi:hypothetical protein
MSVFVQVHLERISNLLDCPVASFRFHYQARRLYHITLHFVNNEQLFPQEKQTSLKMFHFNFSILNIILDIS